MAALDVGSVVVNLRSGNLVTIQSRKEEDTGWWVIDNYGYDSGGLADSVIADGGWVGLEDLLLAYQSRVGA